jgi:hypothetical protein
MKSKKIKPQRLEYLKRLEDYERKMIKLTENKNGKDIRSDDSVDR